MKAYEMCRRMGGLTVLGVLVLALASHAAGGAPVGPAAAPRGVAPGQAAGAEVAQKNLVDLHANAGKLSNKECLACHAGIPKEVSLNKECSRKDAALSKKCKKYHRVHLESKLVTPKNCADCHQSVDLRNDSAAALRKQVDPEICAGCHSGGMKGAKVLYAR